MTTATRTYVHPTTGLHVALCYQRVGREHAVSVVSQSGEAEEYETNRYARVEAARLCWAARREQLADAGFVPAR